MTKRVIIAGITGSMGQKCADLIESLTDFELAGVIAPDLTADCPAAKKLSSETKLFIDLKDLTLAADIWLDFTTPQAVFNNTKFALEHHYRPIIGTSGLTETQISKLQEIAAKEQMGGIIVPNFGLSAVLLMKFVQMAAQYFPDAEVIEMHHEDKLDAPSGTAAATAQLIAKSRLEKPLAPAAHVAARGADYEGVKVHSVRLPGYVAHEEVLFGGPGEALTIRQDSFDRASFMQGVKVALEHVSELSELVVGLDKIL
ncbi:4-hydroxy-tetrahydrodipicolinate reductase [Xylocopilactobacillus apicola]|uniref:4-hydroxy-tetrahydrodipicolinate reductase n=1 Tax=Xylocopilactobacillus apicola TaxID=2932184 RepID=A0AAU9DBZ8_9LACO|nr:4-hydroxy-tetrahydrodipicolinate reductase [Xylocopilactobacillus apicola]BDR59080.1 4-hydroxy-tetrahydrodipicolinate reductase [Xylocopilactobacillus apicola]